MPEKPSLLVCIALNSANWMYTNRKGMVFGNAIDVELRDERGNSHGIGSVVVIEYSGAGQQMREIQAGGGYMSVDAPMAHFGLGAERVVERIRVRWSTGEPSELEDPFPAGAHYPVTRLAAPATNSHSQSENRGEQLTVPFFASR